MQVDTRREREHGSGDQSDAGANALHPGLRFLRQPPHKWHVLRLLQGALAEAAGGHTTSPGERAAAALAGSPGEAPVAVETTPEPSTDGLAQTEESKSSSPSPVTQQMTAMSISQDSGPIDSDQAEADEEEEDEDEGPSKPSGETAEAAEAVSDGDQTPDKNKKKNRCFSCRKKVGLTGFDCRCGNLFCAVHRYSDKHDCPFDYRGAATARLRKENPIVVAEKIQKL
ncbi:hypothetical protein ANANG_G00130040 [Anguilla anguilla]|uniref:AN1-type domain-containing protein n=1 Tax=Anguilla anguilla TaxID=7936 RepID=A0A9D3RXX3_ANGAN|nr:hypothetical protein ANANG_G00130040 [Anguilla anguilla]